MPDLPPMPARIRRLPLDHRGFPVPWFVHVADGVPDFRVIGRGKITRAVNGDRCWICGEPLGRFKAFVIGPMCAVNRISSEPPSHRDCAEFAVRACPFLTKPRMRRNEKDLPENNAPPGMILRNPGVTLLWITESYKILRPIGGVLFYIGLPVETQWFCEGRAATRAEVMASIESGLPLLQMEAEREGPAAVAALPKLTEAALRLVPAE